MQNEDFKTIQIIYLLTDLVAQRHRERQSAIDNKENKQTNSTKNNARIAYLSNLSTMYLIVQLITKLTFMPT